MDFIEESQHKDQKLDKSPCGEKQCVHVMDLWQKENHSQCVIVLNEYDFQIMRRDPLYQKNPYFFKLSTSEIHLLPAFLTEPTSFLSHHFSTCLQSSRF